MEQGNETSRRLLGTGIALLSIPLWVTMCSEGDPDRLAGGFLLGLIVIIVGLVVAHSGRPAPPTSLGHTAWRRADRMEKAGMLAPADKGRGVILGRGPVPGDSETNVPSQQQAWKGYHDPGKFVRYNGDGHLLTVAATGKGKGTTVVIPNLLDYPGSAVVMDPKGENAAVTAQYRREVLGQEVHVLDPWDVSGQGCDAINPLSWLDDGPDLADDAAMLANTLIKRERSEGAEGHFNDQAEDLLRGLIVHAATAEQEPRRTLLTVREYLTSAPEAWEDLLRTKMPENPAANGLAGKTANRMRQRSEKEASAILSTAQRHTNFLDSGRMERVLDHSDFRPESLKEKPTTVYLCLPNHQIEAFSRWLRLMTALLLAATQRSPAPAERDVLFLLDEFPALGRMGIVERAVSEARGYGVKLWLFAQSVPQLKNIYGDGWENFIGQAGVVQVFGINDVETSEYFSKLTGDITKVTESRTGDRVSTSETKHPFVTPQLFRRLDSKYRTVFESSGGMPIMCWDVNYLEHSYFKGRWAENPLHQGTGTA